MGQFGTSSHFTCSFAALEGKLKILTNGTQRARNAGGGFFRRLPKSGRSGKERDHKHKVCLSFACENQAGNLLTITAMTASATPRCRSIDVERRIPASDRAVCLLGRGVLASVHTTLIGGDCTNRSIVRNRTSGDRSAFGFMIPASFTSRFRVILDSVEQSRCASIHTVRAAHQTQGMLVAAYHINRYE